ncbi:MAG TPA: nucleotidyltransferase family protein [Acidiferrobacterales bacterium]|jgi:predicted nucleotidyltransferase
MDRTIVEKLLSNQHARLRELGVKSLSVFGSVARGEARPDSDVDMLVEFDSTPDFDRYMDLKFFLEDLLGRRVDLVTPAALKARMRPTVQREAVRVA